MNNTFNESNIVIIKKNGSHEKWNSEKILRAVGKSANRVLVTFTEEEQEKILTLVKEKLAKLNKNKIAIFEMHSAVEYALNNVNEEVAKAYKDFRNYKTEIGEMIDLVQTEENRIRYIGDKSNANKDAKLVATKRSLIYGEYSTLSFEKFHLTKEERQAARDGYIYIHDKDSRKDTMNCCLFDVKNVLSGGFEMGNLWYNEPKTLDVAFDVIGDIVLATAAQQYGGFTVPEVDTLLEPYAEKSYEIHFKNYIEVAKEAATLTDGKPNEYSMSLLYEKADEYAMRKLKRECEQGMQGIEYKLNTVASSRGDYPLDQI